ncbi:MAG: hypothetical protein RMJ83_07260 [Armatimonadota bacterium]|nr:hypothetical protein [Armatimonadota bacterium]
MLIHFGTNSDDKQLSSCSAWAISTNIYIREKGRLAYRLLVFNTASLYMRERRDAPQRFYFRVAYRGMREQGVGTLNPEVAVSLGG